MIPERTLMIAEFAALDQKFKKERAHEINRAIAKAVSPRGWRLLLAYGWVCNQLQQLSKLKSR
jgi:hypothetical protein